MNLGNLFFIVSELSCWDFFHEQIDFDHHSFFSMDQIYRLTHQWWDIDCHMWISENMTSFFLPAVCLELVNLSWDFQQIFAIRRSTHLACPLRLREDLGKSSTGVPKVVCVAVRAGFLFFQFLLYSSGYSSNLGTISGSHKFGHIGTLCSSTGRTICGVQ